MSGEENKKTAQGIEILDREAILAKEQEVAHAHVYQPPAKLPLIDKVTLKISTIVMCLPIFIVTIIFYEVLVRYVLLKPTLWVNEMSLWVAGFIYLFAGVYTMQQRAHIRVTVVYDLVGPRMRAVFDVITILCIAGFTIGLILGSWEAVYKTVARWEKFGTAWNPPIPATVKPAILIASLLLCLQAISNFIHDKDAYGRPRDKYAGRDDDSSAGDDGNGKEA